MNQTRNAEGDDEKRTSAVLSDNDFRFLDLRQDLSWSITDAQLARFGFNLGDHDGDYDYALRSSIHDPLIAPVPTSR